MTNKLEELTRRVQEAFADEGSAVEEYKHLAHIALGFNMVQTSVDLHKIAADEVSHRRVLMEIQKRLTTRPTVTVKTKEGLELW